MNFSPAYFLSLLRIMTGLLFGEHGTQKLLNFPPQASGHHALDTLGMISAVLELVGGLLITLGLFTRPVAFVLSGEMAVAYFMVHAPQSLYPVVNKGESAVLFCFIFLYLAFSGGGPWSLDALMRRRGRV